MRRQPISSPLRRCLPVALILMSVLLAAPSAGADFQTLYDDYRADGVIDGCAISAGELSSGLSEIPADVREYDPGFAAAINSALEQAAGGCDAAPQAAKIENEVTAPDGSPGPARPKPLAFASTDSGRGMPAVLVGLMVVLGAALGTAALLVASRRYGWDVPGRLAGLARRRTRPPPPG